MTEDKSIQIKNVYYMLAYAFRVLNQIGFEKIAAEEFDNIYNLFAEILSKGVSQQLKRGLYKEYQVKEETLTTVRGKIQVYGSMIHQMNNKLLVDCTYDDLTTNNILNRIIRTTLWVLIREKTLDNVRRANLKRVLLYFEKIDFIDPKDIQWNKLSYHRHNQTYEMLINICHFILQGMLITTEKGEFMLGAFSDDDMAKLFEKFVLEYYKKHHADLDEIRSYQVKWNVSDNDDPFIRFLPLMKTDIVLKKQSKTVIIDTKYYGKSMQKFYDKYTLHSNNLYQIFTYVKNYDIQKNGQVSGVLLYAKTDEDVTPDFSYVIDGNRFSVRTLDLSKDFKVICKQLDYIAYDHFKNDIQIK